MFTPRDEIGTLNSRDPLKVKNGKTVNNSKFHFRIEYYMKQTMYSENIILETLGSELYS